MGNDLSVGLRLEHHAAGFEAIPQLPVIFDDAVLHHGHAAIGTAMGVSIVFFQVFRGWPSGCGRCRIGLGPPGPQHAG